jgi:signal transduction histidine kinase
MERSALGSFWPLRFGLGLSVLTGGIALLAVWAARRVTVPLGRFAQAAGRLGTDVNTPPMAEAGPSEIVQAARAFNQMQERIQRLVDDRTRMLAAIAHDLRTVLTRLRLRAELIDDAEQQGKAIADLDAMATMLDETLAFARDDSAGEARQDVDLAALVRSLCDDMADAGQSVRYLGPDRLRFAGRPVALRRALANLIDNAVKYGREAEVGLQTQRDAIRLAIEDRGPGIPAAAREQVFQPFFRLEPSRSRATGGTGLGLAVARTIVHRHGGEIALDDRPGGGLVVRVTLPAAGP